MKYELINQSSFFLEQGILAIGDLHIGYEHGMKGKGVSLPETQPDEIINDLRKIIFDIGKKGHKLKKIVFLGDIKHFFNYEWREKVYFKKVFEFLSRHVEEKNIILIKGNHDKFDLSGKKMKNYYVSKSLAFTHGHIAYPRIFEEDVKMIVMGHLHPSIMLMDKQGIKREKYKCFLAGKFRGKEVLILPSFMEMVEGTAVNSEYFQSEKGFSIIPEKEIQKFSVKVVNDNGEIMDFGEVRKL